MEGKNMARTKAAVATVAGSDADLLGHAARKATKAAPKAKSELPTKKVGPDLEPEVIDLIGLACIEDDIDPLLKQYKGSVGQKLLDMWLDDMWATKKVPSNFSVPIMKKEGGRDTLKQDMETTFQVKFRSDGLSKIVPDADALPEGVSVEDKIHEALMSPEVGLSEANADKILNPDTGDIRVEQRVELVDSFNALLTSDDELKRTGARKLLKYGQAKPARKGETFVKLEPITDEEHAAIYTTRQVVVLKEGFFERACMYVESREQLGKLIRFVKSTLQLGGFKFGMSDKKADKVSRQAAVLHDFLSVKKDDE
jgi:hypothetical protein